LGTAGFGQKRSFTTRDQIPRCTVTSEKRGAFEYQVIGAIALNDSERDIPLEGGLADARRLSAL
jgi:hypothetical protein